MAMKYYSDKTCKFYDTPEACQQAELEIKEAENREKIRKEREEAHKKELAEQRKDRAAVVEEARKAMNAAQKNYKEVLEAFIRDYGNYHYTSQSFDDIPILFSSLLNIL
mgnify:CR=1 FL=1